MYLTYAGNQLLSLIIKCPPDVYFKVITSKNCQNDIIFNYSKFKSIYTDISIAISDNEISTSTINGFSELQSQQNCDII